MKQKICFLSAMIGCALSSIVFADSERGSVWFDGGAKVQSIDELAPAAITSDERSRLAILKNPIESQVKPGSTNATALANKAISTGLSTAKEILVKNAQDRDNDAFAGFFSRFWFEVNLTQRQVADYSLTTVQPLWESENLDDTIFTQLRFASTHYQSKDRQTGNFGLGYRRFLMDKKILLGVNGFIDHQWPYNHHRLGYGVEMRTSFLDLTANAYKATSKERDAGTLMKERALSGYDLEIGAPLPFLPTTRFYVKHFHWNTRKLGHAIGGQTYAFRVEFLRDMFFETGYTKDNNKTSNAFAAMNIRIPLGDTEPLQPVDFVSDKAYEFKSVENQRLIKVRRNNNIVVERYSSSGGATVNVTKVG